MNSKWHLIISFSKSFIRIFACLLAAKLNNWHVLAIGFGLAEVLGLMEEIKDER